MSFPARRGSLKSNVADAAGGRFSESRPESGNIVPSVFTPVLAKHSKSFSLIDCVSVGVDGFSGISSPCGSRWKPGRGLTEVTAKVVIYEAFVEGQRRKSSLHSFSFLPSQYGSRSTRLSVFPAVLRGNSSMIFTSWTR
jgi:hypothetical protein